MRRISLLLLLAGTVAADGPAYELPRDQKAPVLWISCRGPFVHPRKNNTPCVSIDAEHVKAETKIGADGLQEPGVEPGPLSGQDPRD